MSSRKINAYYNAIMPNHGYAIFARLKEDNEPLPLGHCAWHCHPIQALAIAMIGPPWVELEPPPNPMDLVRRSLRKHTFMMASVNEDESMPTDRIYFERDGVVLAEVVSLAVPAIPKFEDEFEK